MLHHGGLGTVGRGIGDDKSDESFRCGQWDGSWRRVVGGGCCSLVAWCALVPLYKDATAILAARFLPNLCSHIVEKGFNVLIQRVQRIMCPVCHELGNTRTTRDLS